jgi:hypothetical protein
MNKIAIVHLYCQGFTDEDLLDFSLSLSNPSTIAQQQKLELFRTRFETAGSALQIPGLVNRNWVQKNILRLSDEEIRDVRDGLFSDKLTDLELEATQMAPSEGPENSPPPSPEAIPGLDIDMPFEEETPEDLAEKNILSLVDDDAPIKAQSIIDRSSKILNEDADEDDEEEEDKDSLTEFEKWQNKSQTDYKIKRSKAKHSISK